MNPAEIADKYIARDGGPPEGRTDKPDYGPMISLEDIWKVAKFIGWHDARDMWGGVTAEEAFDAFSRILRLDSVEFRKAAGIERTVKEPTD